MRQYFSFLIIIFLAGTILNCAHNNHIAPDEAKTEDPVSLPYEIYREGLQIVDPSHMHVPSREHASEHVQNNRQLVEEYTLKEKIDTSNIKHHLKYWLTQKLYIDMIKDHITPDEETVRAIYEEHKDSFMRRDTIEGASFLIEYGEEADEKVNHWQSVLEESYQSQPEEFSFRDIARNFYLSQGERNDGYFGRVERGRFREEIFDLFFEEDSEKPFFGPVETLHGYLFGKLYNKWEEGVISFDEVRPRLERQVYQNRQQELFDTLLNEAEDNDDIHYLYANKNSSDARDSSQEALKINDRVYTYSDLIRIMPHLQDHSLKTLAENFVVMHGIYQSDEGENIRQIDEFSLLRNALLDEYRVQQFMEEIYAEEITISEENLFAFYQAVREDFYPGYNEYKLRIFELPHNPEGVQDRLAVHQARKDAWTNINHIQDYFLEQKNKAHADLSHFEEEKGLKVQELDEWTSIVQLGGVIGRDIAGRRAGETSSIIIGRNNYLFYYVTDFREGKVRPFEEVKNRVKMHYTLYQQQKIRNRYDIHYASDAPQEFMEKLEEQLTGRQ